VSIRGQQTHLRPPGSHRGFRLSLRQGRAGGNYARLRGLRSVCGWVASPPVPRNGGREGPGPLHGTARRAAEVLLPQGCLTLRHNPSHHIDPVHAASRTSNQIRFFKALNAVSS
jgi:hypothetical protein